MIQSAVFQRLTTDAINDRRNDRRNQWTDNGQKVNGGFFVQMLGYLFLMLMWFVG